MLSVFGRVALETCKPNFRYYKTVRAGQQTIIDVRKREKEVMQVNKNSFLENKLLLEKKAVSKTTAHNEPHPEPQIVDPPIVAYKLACPGCGAKYQYKSSGNPGYLHYDTMVGWDSKSPIHCERCTNVTNSNSEYHQMYSIDGKKFREVIKKISSKRSLGIVVCDIVGFPGSLPPDLEKIYPPRTPIILCLNKCDVVASNESRLAITQEYYRDLVAKWEKTESFAFSDVMFTSARTGTGLPELSILIQQYMYDTDNLEFGELDFCYLIGATNAGKSTMFNKLSPLLNNSVRCVGNVTESALPGTTVQNIKQPIDPPEFIGKRKMTENIISQRVDTLERMLAEPEHPLDDSKYSEWFKYKLDLQLQDTSTSKMLIDTPGVLPEDAIPEATFTSQNRAVYKRILLEPGQCLSFGWYKVYYARGNTSIGLTINSPMISNHKVLYDFSDSDLSYTENGIKLVNKLYLMHNINSRDVKSKNVGDIVLGNFGWVSVNLIPGDDITMCIFGPRLDDISYRTPAFRLRLPIAAQDDDFVIDKNMLDDIEVNRY